MTTIKESRLAQEVVDKLNTNGIYSGDGTVPDGTVVSVSNLSFIAGNGTTGSAGISFVNHEDTAKFEINVLSEDFNTECQFGINPEDGILISKRDTPSSALGGIEIDSGSIIIGLRDTNGSQTSAINMYEDRVEFAINLEFGSEGQVLKSDGNNGVMWGSIPTIQKGTVTATTNSGGIINVTLPIEFTSDYQVFITVHDNLSNIYTHTIVSKGSTLFRIYFNLNGGDAEIVPITFDWLAIQ